MALWSCMGLSWNQIWKYLIVLGSVLCFAQACTDPNDILCSPGKIPELFGCPDGSAQCIPCSEGLYTPYYTQFGDRCMVRRSCDINMEETAESIGDRTQDTVCKCIREGMIKTNVGCFDRKGTDHQHPVSTTPALPVDVTVKRDTDTDKSNGFPLWATILIFVAVLVIAVIIAIVIVRKIYHNQPEIRTDEEANQPLKRTKDEKVTLTLKAADKNFDINSEVIDKMKTDLPNLLTLAMLKVLQRTLFKEGGNDADNINAEENELPEKIFKTLKLWHEKNGDAASARFLVESLNSAKAKKHAEKILKEFYDLDDNGNRIQNVLNQ